MKKLSLAQKRRKKVYAEQYRATHRDVIRRYNQKRHREMVKFRDDLFKDVLKNPRLYLDSVKK
jgi:hypothetical protein